MYQSNDITTVVTVATDYVLSYSSSVHFNKNFFIISKTLLTGLPHRDILKPEGFRLINGINRQVQPDSLRIEDDHI